MFFILLYDVFCVYIVLDDLFVWATSQEDVLLALLRMELYAQRRFAVAEAPNYFACLSVPEVNRSVEGAAEELPAIIGKADISDCLRMPHVCSQALSMRQHIPNLAGSIMAARKHKMAKLWKESNFLHSLWMTLKCMHPFLGYIALRWFSLVRTFKVHGHLGEVLLLSLDAMKYGRCFVNLFLIPLRWLFVLP